MDIINQANSLKLIKRIGNPKISTVSVIPFVPQKKKINYKPSNNKYFIANNQNLSSSLIYSFFKELIDDNTIDLHSISISENGKNVFSFSSPFHDINEPHIIHSASKSITSLAIGILIDENKLNLDDKLCDLFPELYTPMSRIIQKNLNLKHLLTMSSAVQFNEFEIYSDENFAKSYTSSILNCQPGKIFSYNSLNTYMLGRIVEKVSGLKLSKFVNKKIFEPLGITNYLWEECAMGHTKGGWGLYLSNVDLLKIGNLYLNYGKYNNVQIVSENWIKDSVSIKIKTPKELGDYDYGYHVWISRDNKSFLLNGMFGQNIFCFPHNKICISINCGLNDFFQKNNIYKIVNKYFSSLDAKKEFSFSKFNFKNYLRHLSSYYNVPKIKCNSLKFKKSFNKIANKSYKITTQNKASTGIMPLILQVLQNNYTQGIDKISFYKNKGSYYLSIIEGENSYNIPLNSKSPIKLSYKFNGETYNISSLADFAYNEYGQIVLKIKLSFSETASTRFIKITFKENKIIADFSENPQLDFLFENMDYFLKNVSLKSIKDVLLNSIESEFSKNIYNSIINPSLEGYLI